MSTPLIETVLQATNPTSFARGRSVFLYLRGTTTEVSVYRDEARTEAVTQPLRTDAGGVLRENKGGVAGTDYLWIADGVAADLVYGAQRVPLPTSGGGGGGAVASVNGHTGAVTGLEEAANRDTDAALAANSDARYPSQKAIKAYADTKAAKTALEGAAMGTVYHGATAGTARPTGFKFVTWIGSVEPTNAAEHDVWLKA